MACSSANRNILKDKWPGMYMGPNRLSKGQVPQFPQLKRTLNATNALIIFRASNQQYIYIYICMYIEVDGTLHFTEKHEKTSLCIGCTKQRLGVDRHILLILFSRNICVHNKCIASSNYKCTNQRLLTRVITNNFSRLEISHKILNEVASLRKHLKQI